MKRSGFLLIFLLASCQSTKAPKFKRERAKSGLNLESLSPVEMGWYEKAEALHSFMSDYHQNPRNFKARGVLGLSEMQKIILRNRSEAWQPHLAGRGLRVSWSIDSEKGIQPFQWAFTKDWRNQIQERVLAVRRGWLGLSGLTVWILPEDQFLNHLKTEDHAWLKSIGIIATNSRGDFDRDSDALNKKLRIDEDGVYLETELETSVLVKSRVSIVMNDVDPVKVDSSHRFLNRELAVLRANEFIEADRKQKFAVPGEIAEIDRQLNLENEGKADAIEWLEKNFVQINHHHSGSKALGFPGLWEAYLKGFVQVSNVPGLEYQNDPQFLSHLNQLVAVYSPASSRSLAANREIFRSPASDVDRKMDQKAPEVSSTRRVIGLELDDSGPVMGLF